jgi:hypothetical protein
MQRRKFIQLGSTSVCAIPFLGFTSFIETNPIVKPKWVVDLIKLNDEDVTHFSRYKVTDKTNKYFGGYFNDAEIINPHSTCAYINRACAAVATEESKFYRSPEMLEEIREAFLCLNTLQHSDGTIDLIDTNFHSTPDTAFMVKVLAISYKLLKQSKVPSSEKVLIPFQQFLQRAGEALITGGIHTPNHRWVVSAALTKVNELWPDPRYVGRVNEWLGEHIDQDKDGQYTEKSTSGYSAIIDEVLITVAKGLNKPELFDAVRKNILMMRYYMHPNGEVVTEASNRQDKGQIGTMENYYYSCRYMALKDQDGEMAAICRLIETKTPHKLLDNLNMFLEDPTLWKDLPIAKSLPVSYVKSFPYSGVVRIRRNEWDATILSNNPGWFTFHKGNTVLQGMRLATSFFGKGQFQSEQIAQKGDAWVLNKKLDGVYYQPYPKDQIPEDGDYAKMPKTNRQQSNIQHIETTVTISEAKRGVSVDIEINGTESVPVTLELIFRRGGTFTGVEAYQNRQDVYLLRSALASYTNGNDTIQFGPGKAEHKWIQLRGALPAMDAPSVYLTGFTPFKHTINIF